MSIKEKIKYFPNFIKAPAKNIYNSIPEYIKGSSCFKEKYKFLEKSQYWTKSQHEEYQMEQLNKLIKHAYETVPYYKKIFIERGLTPKSIQNFNDLKQLPYLSKEIIQNNLNDLVSNKYNKNNMVYVTTSGSTGIPMAFYDQKYLATDLENAFMFNQWNRVGFDINKRNRCVILRGNILKNGISKKVGDQLILSSFHLSEDNMKKYIKMIEDFQPDFIQAYPSSIDILSDFIIDNGIFIKLKQLKAILCGSENIYAFQRKKIEKAFNTRVYSWYGHTEKCCLSGECEKSDYYHIFSEYGYTELINENGKDVTEEGEVGEIVATGFNNYIVPFIRYKTMDLAVNTNEMCSCGRNYRLIKNIQGREQEQIVTKNGTKISNMIFTQHYNVFEKIKIMQLEQNEIGKVVVKIVKKENFNNDDLNEMINKIKSIVGKQLDIKVKFVTNINRTIAGKYKFLIQNIK